MGLLFVMKVATTPKSIMTKFVSTIFTQIWFPYAYIAWYDVAFNAGGRNSWMASRSLFSPFSFAKDKAYGSQFS